MRLDARSGLRSTGATRHIDLSSSYRQSWVLTMVIARLAYVTKLPGPTEQTSGLAWDRPVICAAQSDKWRHMGHGVARAPTAPDAGPDHDTTC